MGTQGIVQVFSDNEGRKVLVKVSVPVNGTVLELAHRSFPRNWQLMTEYVSPPATPRRARRTQRHLGPVLRRSPSRKQHLTGF